MDSEIMTDEAESPPAPPTAEQKRRRGNARLDELASEARPAETTDATRRRLLDEWEKATIVIARGRQMLKDAILQQEKCAEAIVKRLGRGRIRHKDTLYEPSAKGDTIYLRELKKRPIDG